MRAILIIATCLLGQICQAQRSIVFLELGGNGGFGSLNYERQFANTPRLSLRVGLGISLFGYEKDVPDSDIPGCTLCGLDLPGPETVAPTIPISVQHLFDLQNSNYLESGVGTTWQLSEKSIFVYHISIGFRRYFGNNAKWVWKVNLTPILGVSGENAFKDSEPTIWGGVSIGKEF